MYEPINLGETQGLPVKELQVYNSDGTQIFKGSIDHIYNKICNDVDHEQRVFYKDGELIANPQEYEFEEFSDAVSLALHYVMTGG